MKGNTKYAAGLGFSAFLWIAGVQSQQITEIHRVSVAPTSNAQGQSYSYDPEMDGSGRYIIFTSTADNFAAPGNVPDMVHEHVYLRDTVTNETTQLDVTSSGSTGSPGVSFNPNVRTFGSSFDPHLSRDGKYAVFVSSASDISPDGLGESFGAWAYLKNLETGSIQRIPYSIGDDQTMIEYPTYLAINADGSVVVVMSIVGAVADENCASCVWELTVFDRNAQMTTLLQTGVSGNKFNPGISDDGRFIVFENQVGDFSGPTYSYLYDRSLEVLTALNSGEVALSPAISGDGNYIAYTDTSGVPSRIYLQERGTGQVTPVSVGLNGTEPRGISEFPSLSQDGRYVAFLSTANNLVRSDSNGTDDIFVYDRVTGTTTLVSVQGSCTGITSQEDFNTGPPTISSDGRIITFTVLERLIAAPVKDETGNVIEVADSNSFDDVYYAVIDYDAEPDRFRVGLTPSAPRVSVNCRGEEATLRIEKILLPSAMSSSGVHGRGEADEIRKVRQEIIIKGTGRRSDVQRKVAARNAVTARELPPGTYTARVRATGVKKDGGTVQTRFSPPARFTIDD